MSNEPLTTMMQRLRGWLVGEALEPAIWQSLAAWELSEPLRAQAFRLTASNVAEQIQQRSHLLRKIYPAFRQLGRKILGDRDRCERASSHGDDTESEELRLLRILWCLWLPLATQLAHQRQQQGQPLIQGLLGGQGTGKTTLGKILKLILEQLGYRLLSLSLDDLYKTYEERLQLQALDPRLLWRGPPGTHDIALGLAVLDRVLRAEPGQTVAIPRFDKSAWNGAGDRTDAEIVQDIDIVLFEGWFVGVQPIDPIALTAAPPPITTEADRAFARDMNARLQAYLPLWDRLDRLMVLYPLDYRLSQQWRRQAEQRAIAAGKTGMTDVEIDQFVEYFWRALHPRLFIEPLVSAPTQVDLVIAIGPDRSPVLVYRPQDRQPLP